MELSSYYITPSGKLSVDSPCKGEKPWIVDGCFFGKIKKEPLFMFEIEM